MYLQAHCADMRRLFLSHGLMMFDFVQQFSGSQLTQLCFFVEIQARHRRWGIQTIVRRTQNRCSTPRRLVVWNHAIL